MNLPIRRQAVRLIPMVLSIDGSDTDFNAIQYQAMVGNSSIKMLDLSHNMIGDKETYNFVRPDYTTGGEAVAEMLEVSTP